MAPLKSVSLRQATLKEIGNSTLSNWIIFSKVQETVPNNFSFTDPSIVGNLRILFQRCKTNAYYGRWADFSYYLKG